LNPFGSGIGIPLSSFIVPLSYLARDGTGMLRAIVLPNRTLFDALEIKGSARYSPRLTPRTLDRRRQSGRKYGCDEKSHTTEDKDLTAQEL
jgi:hypothetical protein